MATAEWHVNQHHGQGYYRLPSNFFSYFTEMAPLLQACGTNGFQTWSPPSHKCVASTTISQEKTSKAPRHSRTTWLQYKDRGKHGSIGEGRRSHALAIIDTEHSIMGHATEEKNHPQSQANSLAHIRFDNENILPRKCTPHILL